MLSDSMQTVANTLATADAEYATVDAEYDILWKKSFSGPWTHPDVSSPQFEDVFDAFIANPDAAKAKYGPIRESKRAHKKERAENAKKLKEVGGHKDSLSAEIKQHRATLRENAKAQGMAKYTAMHAHLDAEGLKQCGKAVYSRLRTEMFGREYKFGGFLRDEDKIKELDLEVDAIVKLLIPHNVKTTYVNNEIVFTETESAGAKRLKRAV